MTNAKRKKLYIVPQVQSKLLVRVVVYWASCILFVILPVLLGHVLTDPSRLFYEHIPDVWRQFSHIAVPIVLVLPLLLLDMLRYSNRLAGPLFRMRREMNALADGQEVHHLAFRDKDEWQELAEAFNRVADELRDARRQAASSSNTNEALEDAEQENLELSHS